MVRLYCEHEDGAKMQLILDEAEARLKDFVRRESGSRDTRLPTSG